MSPCPFYHWTRSHFLLTLLLLPLLRRARGRVTLASNEGQVRLSSVIVKTSHPGESPIGSKCSFPSGQIEFRGPAWDCGVFFDANSQGKSSQDQPPAIARINISSVVHRSASLDDFEITTRIREPYVLSLAWRVGFGRCFGEKSRDSESKRLRCDRLTSGSLLFVRWFKHTFCWSSHKFCWLNQILSGCTLVPSP